MASCSGSASENQAVADHSFGVESCAFEEIGQKRDFVAAFELLAAAEICSGHVTSDRRLGLGWEVAVGLEFRAWERMEGCLLPSVGDAGHSALPSEAAFAFGEVCSDSVQEQQGSDYLDQGHH